MLGERLLEEFSEYDLKEVDRTFGQLSNVCSALHGLKKGSRGTKETWDKLFSLTEELDFLFIEGD